MLLTNRANKAAQLDKAEIQNAVKIIRSSAMTIKSLAKVFDVCEPLCRGWIHDGRIPLLKKHRDAIIAYSQVLKKQGSTIV